jgi:DNA-binding transcriptional regulator GbsR (MarR family)
LLKLVNPDYVAHVRDTDDTDDTDRQRLMDWVERLAMFLAQDGVPPIAGRCLGWLMVCDPPAQSAGQIAVAIGASRGSLTTSLRVLSAMGFVTRRTRPGERTAYYRVDDNAWDKVVQRQIATLTAYRDLVADGAALLGRETGRAARIQEAYDTFDWMAKVFDNAPPRPPTSGNGERP